MKQLLRSIPLAEHFRSNRTMENDTAQFISRQRVLEQLSKRLLQEMAEDIDEQFGGGYISPSIYETAWVAMLRNPADSAQPIFPEALSWVRSRQNSDGSWGPAYPYNVLPSLAAFTALKHTPSCSEKDAASLSKAETALQTIFNRWRADDIDTPLYEFIIVALDKQLKLLECNLNIGGMDLMQARIAEKFNRLPMEYVYSGVSNISHAFEALGESIDFSRVKPLQGEYGGYGNSAASTAAALMFGKEWDEKAELWIQRLLTKSANSFGASVPASHPSDAFELSWSLFHLHTAGIDFVHKDPAAAKILYWLEHSLTDNGTSFSRMKGLPVDSDDTAMVLAVLAASGAPKPIDALLRFLSGGHFVSYIGERSASSSANAHALDALLLSGDGLANGQYRKLAGDIVQYLLDTRDARGVWRDKWHISSLYATYSCVGAIIRSQIPAALPELNIALNWLLKQQRTDGGWGEFASTAEETAYALLALYDLRFLSGGSARKARIHAMQSGVTYLWAHITTAFHAEDLPELWVDKTLYSAPRVILSAIIAALHVTETELFQTKA